MHLLPIGRLYALFAAADPSYTTMQDISGRPFTESDLIEAKLFMNSKVHGASETSKNVANRLSGIVNEMTVEDASHTISESTERNNKHGIAR